MFCRNCDTAIEVSERDVSAFESMGTFACPSCKEDLSARMADLLGASRVSPSEERTVPEEAADADAFDGLPVGGSLDDAARAMRAPAPTPSSSFSGGGAIASAADAADTIEVAPEDPLTLALRIAQQAQAAAMAAAAAAEAPATNGAHPVSEPALEATAPGIPHFSNGNTSEIAPPAASSEVGVVPEEPDNEDTVRRAGLVTAPSIDSSIGESTIPEPTLPSESDLLVNDTSDSGPVVGEEMTPALTEAQRLALLAEENEPDTIVDEPSQPGTVPDAPSTESTPSAPRASPMPVEPREEPTIRKTGPPPTLVAPARLAPRTGTGPSGIGALGFRISSNRAVVRPSGRLGAAASGAPTTPAAGTPMSGSTSIERTSAERSIERPSRTNMPIAGARAPQPTPVVMGSVPEPPPIVAGRVTGGDERRPALPIWVFGIGIGFVAIIVVGLAYVIFRGPPDKPVATPTPVTDATPEVTETAIVALGTPIATPATTATRTPAPTAARTAAPTATPVPTVSATQTSLVLATPVATKAATPRPPTAKERIDQIRSKPPAVARLEIYSQALKEPSDADFVFGAFKYLKDPPAGTAKDDADSSRKLAKAVAKDFVTRFRNDLRAPPVRNWIELYEKSNP